MCLGNLADQLCFPHNRQPGEEASLAACLDAARLPALIERCAARLKFCAPASGGGRPEGGRAGRGAGMPARTSPVPGLLALLGPWSSWLVLPCTVPGK